MAVTSASVWDTVGKYRKYLGYFLKVFVSHLPSEPYPPCPREEGHWGESAHSVWNISHGKCALTVKITVVQAHASFSLYSVSTPVLELYTSLESAVNEKCVNLEFLSSKGCARRTVVLSC